jgi:hypothetical protein
MSISLTSGYIIRISVLYSAYINGLAEPCCIVLRPLEAWEMQNPHGVLRLRLRSGLCGPWFGLRHLGCWHWHLLLPWLP